ncbi:MAG: sigma-70 family RNA polymerase sigma factor [Acidobacteria bacterium]|nr:sigma-70 family RNA polymerase sigma factor [Gemmatimonadota bacterium]MYB33193.1 sigma-70 family RNA polymerase sigma factor [Acidobacteriota bacterium]MYF13371.1 sigma-70 family RNA polymerase sigma factor [Acidobacteriota bacterium]MYH22956.1 sigma-70 family RNA polymerase sigma factor [Acidobacteriota bacterium]MYI96686.1 sigma-70 family RNA polymerase sigma factor [Acidobacteriota bacterium]
MDVAREGVTTSRLRRRTGPGDLDSLSIYFREIGPNGGKDASSGPPCCAPRESAGKVGRSAFRCLGPDAPGVGRCALVVGHLRLVVVLARRYHHLNLPLEDLIQEGNIGLVAAARRFDPKHHGEFSNHAARYIRQAICRALSQARTIRIPQKPLALRRLAATVAAELEQRYRNAECHGGRHRHHRLEDDAAEIGVDPDELRETVRLVPAVESLDASVGSHKVPLSARIADPRSPNPEDDTIGYEERRHLRDAVAQLPSRLRHIMERRYGLDGRQAATLAEIGRALGLTPPRVHQLHGKALEVLRNDRRFQHPAR